MTRLAAVPEPASSAALERVVETAIRMEQHEEVDRWDFADDVLEAVNDLADDQNGFGHPPHPHTKTGLYRAVDEVNDRLRDAKVSSVGRQSIVDSYTTAKAWPEETRVAGANYWAHYELRVRAYDDGRRQAILNRLVEKSDRPVGTPQVRLWKSDQKHEPVVAFLDQVERGVRGFLKRKGNPWDRVGFDDRRQIARMLRAVAAEVEAGEFGQ